MKRLLFIAVIWGAALLPPAAQAQMRGGMGFRGTGAAPARTPSGFAGRPSGFAPRPSGFAQRPVVGMGFRSRVSARPVRVNSPQSRVFISGRRTFFPGRRVFFPNRRFHRFARNPFFFPGTCFNGVFDPFCRNGFFFGSSFGWPYDPFLSGFSSFPPEQQQPVVVEQDGNSRELALEVQELSDEIQAMRDEERTRESRNTASNQAASRDDGPNATLVFRDGLQLSVRNYAIAGDTIWVLDEHKAQKIPIAKLDVAATEQVNARNGVELHLPK